MHHGFQQYDDELKDEIEYELDHLDDELIEGVVRSEELSVIRIPEDGAKVIRVLKCGDTVLITNEVDDYYYIMDQFGNFGYCKKEYIEV